MWRYVTTLSLGLVLLTACSDEPDRPSEASATESSTEPPGDDSTEASPKQRLKPFDPDAVRADVRRLANHIGPREATSASFRRATRFVSQRLASLGYDVRRTRVPVPAGDSWGVPVEAGTSYNVVADPPDFDPHRPYRIVGAHLDSVAVSPGAEDNASGTSVVLELARLAAERTLAVPVRFIAFGAEEPRGEGDNLHHFGSRKFVRQLSGAERNSLDGMVSLDRVGVRAAAVPICLAGSDGGDLRREVVRSARALRIPSTQCEDRASDHWSFERAGLSAVRLGSVPYAGYHSAQDRPHYVDRRQVRRVGRIMWRWLQSSR